MYISSVGISRKLNLTIMFKNEWWKRYVDIEFYE